MSDSQTMPSLTSVRLEPSMVEEWYGVKVTFFWENRPLSQEQVDRLRIQMQQERNVASQRCQARSRPGHPFPRRQRDDFATHGIVLGLLDAIRTSVEWKTFYADPERSTLYGQLDGTGERHGYVKLPQFQEDSLLSIEIDMNEGEVSFQSRDA